MNSNSKTIAKNTIVVYLRIFITMFVGLFSSRFVLQALGESDYGLYSVVGGVIALFSFLSGALSQTTTRYINFEKAQPSGNVNKIFNISLVIHISFSIIIVLIAEILGMFYVHNYLVVDSNKIQDAIFVFQTSLITTCLSVLTIPFQSIFVANEKFLFIAIIEIIQTVVRFLFVISMLYYTGNNLRYYAVIMALTTLAGSVAYVIIACKKWKSITIWHFYSDRKAYANMLYFNNYTLLGAGALVTRSQGSMMVVNYFFGTSVNAAYAIANNVQSYVNLFIGNFDTASGPQITQLVSSGKIEESLKLVTRTCRICILLMCVVYFPLLVELSTILNLWLGDVPEHTVTLCKYTLGIAVVSATSGGLSKFIAAIGRIKWFQIQYSILYFLCIPASIILLAIGVNVYVVPLLFIISDVISRMIQLYLLHRYINLDVKKYIVESYTRPIIVFCILYVFVLCYSIFQPTDLIYKFMGVAITGLVSVSTVLLFGLNKAERNAVTMMFIKRKKQIYE